MRIGFITGEYPPMQGGIGAHCRILAKTLSAQGHTVYIFSDEQARESDLAIHLTSKQGKWRLNTLRSIDQWTADHQLDVVNLHYQTAAFDMSPWIHFIPRFVKASPLITTFHDLRFPYLFPKASIWRPWIVHHLAKTSAGVISTNHEDAEKLSHLPQNTLIPIGSSVETTLPAGFNRDDCRQSFGATPDDIVIAHFGFINHSKGIDTLLESLAALQKAGHPIRLLMIGGKTGSSDPSNMAYVQSIDKKIAELAIYHIVHWTGFVNDQQASAYFNAADLVVFPYKDGASYRRSSLMAAIAHECAIITSKPAVDISTFRNGENLMLVAPDNYAALAAAIQVLSSDSELKNKIKTGVKELKQVFNWDAIAHKNVAFFERMLA